MLGLARRGDLVRDQALSIRPLVRGDHITRNLVAHLVSAAGFAREGPQHPLARVRELELPVVAPEPPLRAHGVAGLAPPPWHVLRVRVGPPRILGPQVVRGLALVGEHFERSVAVVDEDQAPVCPAGLVLPQLVLRCDHGPALQGVELDRPGLVGQLHEALNVFLVAVSPQIRKVPKVAAAVLSVPGAGKRPARVDVLLA
mmetsp:Transcript_20232/g.49631  ORF Transcript_20232/g.49631 Transcript_20232/m.49631 type:complete len:200 (+) Transcript_20232:358-957(+)